MQPDIQLFSLKRNLFPRQPNLATNSLICGHLNRIKFPPNIKSYLQQRKNGASVAKAMSKASRCFCGNSEKPKDLGKEQMMQIENDIKENRGLVQKLEKLEIKAPKQMARNAHKKIT